MTDSIEDIIGASIAGPKKVSSDGVSVEQHSIPDLIDADKHNAGKAAVRVPGLGIKMTRVSPRGTI